MKELAPLTNLARLIIPARSVTAKGERELKQMLPKCYFDRW